MNKIKQKLRQLVELPSDINQHLYNLMGYAEGCNHITEMGVRGVVSTWAFLAANPKKFVGIDIVDCPVEESKQFAEEAGIEYQFIKADTIDPNFEIEETDFLFIDTLHSYTQLKQELAKHAGKVRQYIGFHDTTTFGFQNEPGVVTTPYSGLRPAIMEFLEAHPEWQFQNTWDHNNGVTILKRK